MKTMLLFLLLALCCGAQPPTIEIRQPENEATPGYIEFWARVPKGEVWIFEISHDSGRTWTPATNTTVFPDGWQYYATATTAQHLEFVRMRKP